MDKLYGLEGQKCPIHPEYSIEFICLQQHLSPCQKKLCIKCKQDEIHQSIDSCNLLTPSFFITYLKTCANVLIDEKKKFKGFRKKISSIFESLEQSIQNQKEMFNKAIQNHRSTFEIGEKLLKKLEQNSIFDCSDTSFDEMVYLIQTYFYGKQKIINENNLKALEQTRKQLDQFSQDLERLQCQYIKSHECKENFYSPTSPTEWMYQIKLPNVSMKVQQENFILYKNIHIDIFNNFTKMQSLDYIPNDQITLTDIGKFVQEQLQQSQIALNYEQNYKIWIYQSQYLQKQLYFEQNVYILIKNDHIKINVAQSQDIFLQSKPHENDQMVNLTISIIDGNITHLLRSKFSKNKTILDLNDSISNYFDLKKKETVVDIQIQQQIYKGTKAEKTLFQLQIKDGTLIEVRVRRMTQQPIQQAQPNLLDNDRSIVLNLKIEDGPYDFNFQQRFRSLETLDDVAQRVAECCQILPEHATIDLYVFCMAYNNPKKRKYTLSYLQLKDNTEILGRVRWIDG